MHLVSNMICIIKVGILARKLDVVVPYSKYCVNILSVIYRLGFIRGFVVIDTRKIRVLLKYVAVNRSVIRNICVISKPSRRVYWTHKRIGTSVNHKPQGGYTLISTSSGIFTNYECCESNMGGEIILHIG